MNTYDTFLENYSQDLALASKRLYAMSRDQSTHTMNIKSEAIDIISDTYDKSVCRFIESMIFRVERRTTVTEIATCALENMNRNGTEMQMIIYAIEQVYNFVERNHGLV